MTQPQYEKSAGWAGHKSDYDKIMKLHGQGVEPKFIAERVGVNPSTVRKVIRELCGKMGRVVIILAVLIAPQYPDTTPGDGFMDSGSYSNPLIIRQDGETIGTMRPRYHDNAPGDGFNDDGSYTNPYEIYE